jgi:hypothetical protein
MPKRDDEKKLTAAERQELVRHRHIPCTHCQTWMKYVGGEEAVPDPDWWKPQWLTVALFGCETCDEQAIAIGPPLSV